MVLLCLLLFRLSLKSPWSRRRRKHALLPKQWKRLFGPDSRLSDGGVKFLKKVRSGVSCLSSHLWTMWCFIWQHVYIGLWKFFDRFLMLCIDNAGCWSQYQSRGLAISSWSVSIKALEFNCFITFCINPGNVCFDLIWFVN